MIQQALTMSEAQRRILALIYSHPQGLTVSQLIDQLKRRGWCESDLMPEDLGLCGNDILRPPRMASNDP